MRSLLFALVFSATAAYGQVTVIGDSISSQEQSWPQYLRSDHGYHVLVDARAGRKAAYYVLSPDFFCPFGGDVVVLLGANDATDTQAMLFYEGQMYALLGTLKSKGCRTLLLVPPDFGLPTHPMGPVRAVQNTWCVLVSQLGVNAHCLDLNALWNPSQTSDGLHPLPVLSQSIAAAVAAALQ